MEDRHQRLEDLFHRARGLPRDRLRELLDRECDGDAALRLEVEELLALDDATRAAPIQAPFDRIAAGTDAIPEQIGPYRVVRVISTGGMGTVYEATQQNPQRTVAVKTVRRGVLGEEVLRRFQAEIEVLARLRHPGIGQIYEAGMHGEGAAAIPYFAMEYIPSAEPITEWVRGRNLDLRATLALFASVCDAVHHAHRKGVIHRDLKPANILVDASQEAPHAKIIDFGIARVTDRDAVLVTKATTTGQILGTLQYMSPEQLAGGAATSDERSDVYSLGLLLYEMLAGKPPHIVSGLPIAEAVRLLSESDPPRLGLDSPALRGDVETIVGKAMEKEPARRYGGADELAADVRRHLMDEPILAHPPSGFYRAQKFVKRNKALVVGVVATILVLAAGLVAALVVATREGRAREVAERQTYASDMLAVGSALEQWRFDAARVLLDRAPPRLRGWEWRHFRQRAEYRPEEIRLAFGSLRAFAMNGAGTRYVTTSGDATLRVWDAADGRLLRSLALPASSDFLFVRDDLVVVMSPLESTTKWIAACRLSEGCRLSLLPAHLDRGSVYDVDRNGLALIGGDPRHLAVRDLIRDHLVARHESREAIVTAQWSEDGRRVAVGLEDGRVEILDGPTLKTIRTMQTHLERIDQLQLDGTGRRLAVSSSDGSLQLWPDTADAEAMPTLLQDRQKPISVLRFSRDGSLLAIAADRIVRVWDTAEGRLRKSVEIPAFGLAFRREDARLVVLSDVAGRIWILDTTSMDVPTLHGHASYVYPVGVSPDGSMIVSGGWDGFVDRPGSLRLWDAASGEPIAAIGEAPRFVRAAAFSPDGATAAVAWSRHAENGVAILDLRTGALRELLPGQDVFESVAYDREGRRLALAAVPDVLRIVEVDSGRILAERSTVTTNWALQSRVAWSGDGRWLAVSSQHGLIELWDGLTLRPRRKLEGHTDLVRSLSFSPDGALLASASKDESVRVWEIETGRCVATLLGRDREVLAVAFSPDGRRLASGGHDAKVRLWDTQSWNEVAELSGHDWYVYSLAWSPDGKRLVSGSGDGTVRIWETDPADLRSLARKNRAEILARVAPRVRGWLDELKSGEAVAARIAADSTLDTRDRQIALQALLAESLARSKR